MAARILLIEPDKSLLGVYEETLSRSGYIVDTASGAQEAINTADKNKPNLVIMEIQLIKHNGIEFLYEFRSYPEWKAIPVLIHTLIPPTEFTENMIFQNNLMISDYLYKPRTTLSKLKYSIAAYIT